MTGPRLRKGPALTLLVLGLACVCAAGRCVRIDTYGKLVRELRSSEPSELSLSVKKCSEPGPFLEAYVEATTWLEGDVFYALIVIAANCSDDYWFGNYRVEEGNKLILEYTTIRAGGEDACVCRAELEYRIVGLVKRDYSVKIRQAGTRVP